MYKLKIKDVNVNLMCMVLMNDFNRIQNHVCEI